MKRNRIFIGLLIFISCFVIIPMIKPVNATTSKQENFIYYPNNKDMNNYEIQIENEDVYDIENVKIISNTDTSVAKIKVEKEWDFAINIKLLKPGKTTIIFEIITNEYSDEAEGFIKCKKERSFTINSIKYVCPIKKLKIGKNDYTNKFKNSPFYNIKKSKVIKKKKLTVKPVANWKITGIYLEYAKGCGIMEKKLKNNKYFSSPKTGGIFIIMCNEKLNITEELYLDL